MNTTQLSKAISALKRSTARQRTVVQALGLAAAEHASQEGDCVFLTRLLDAMGAGMTRRAAIVWMTKHCPITTKTAKPGTRDTFQADGKAYVVTQDKTRREAGETYNLVAMAAEDWFSATPENAVKTLDTLKTIKAAIARHFATVAKGERPVVAGQEDELRVLAAMLNVDIGGNSVEVNVVETEVEDEDLADAA